MNWILGHMIWYISGILDDTSIFDKDVVDKKQNQVWECLIDTILECIARISNTTKMK